MRASQLLLPVPAVSFLRFAGFTGVCALLVFSSLPASAETAFVRNIIDQGSVGEHASMVLDANDDPHFAYFDAAAGAGGLKYATSSQRAHATIIGGSAYFFPVPCAPENPGDSVNCGDFDTYDDAKNWFDTYFLFYGDVANLDADDNGIPCEGLPGAP